MRRSETREVENSIYIRRAPKLGFKFAFAKIEGDFPGVLNSKRVFRRSGAISVFKFVTESLMSRNA